jgi:hypothetical protein
MPAILVADRKSVENVFDGREADPLQVGRSLRSNAFQILKRRLEVVGSRHR